MLSSLESSKQWAEPPRSASFFQFSIRSFLWLFTAAIVLAWVIRQALRGSEILVAIAAMALLVLGFMALCSVAFLIGWFPAFVSGERKLRSQDSPFTPGPQPPAELLQPHHAPVDLSLQSTELSEPADRSPPVELESTESTENENPAGAAAEESDAADEKSPHGPDRPEEV
ncbi:hypothetical protein [Roseimaritima sediminicola]|uniref:hypothetical protein n=1 Tax=Roseimaritima sediminicola TaxID=2662066 RepID=UPI0013871433|nr:hypothetical protein [Roseimaritima sediminicola]